VNRTFDTAAFERVVHHPEVKPYLSLGQEIPNLAPYITDPRNYCYMNEFGGFLLVNSGPDEYDVHTAFLPEGRGPHLVELAISVRDRMFQENGAVVLRTFVEHGNVAARRLAKAAGFCVVHEATLFDVPGVVMTLERKSVCQ